MPTLETVAVPEVIATDDAMVPAVFDAKVKNAAISVQPCVGIMPASTFIGATVVVAACIAKVGYWNPAGPPVAVAPIFVTYVRFALLVPPAVGTAIVMEV